MGSKDKWECIISSESADPIHLDIQIGLLPHVVCPYLLAGKENPNLTISCGSFINVGIVENYDG